jgi:lysozyme family protein
VEKFLKALKKTLKWEGGISSHSSDLGGYTNRGISLRFLHTIGLDLNKDGSIDELDLKDISENAVLYIYKTYFWDKIRADEIKSPIIAGHLFDIAVNTGNKRAIKLIQEACNDFGNNLKVDGIIGNKTIDAINSCNVLLLNATIGYNRRDFYENLAEKNPNLKVFLKGWINRTNDFMSGVDYDEFI